MTTTGKLFFGTLLLIILGGSVYYFGYYGKVVPTQEAMFTIEGEQITLVDGKYEHASAPGSASMTTITYFGNEASGDFNGDGVTDKTYLVTYTNGGSGTFYYLATSLGGEAVLLGDRIAPQTTEYRDGEIIVNYAIRRDSDPMTTSPSIGVSRYFKFENGKLTEIKREVPKTSTTTPPTGKVSENSDEGKCVNAGGQWSKEYKECTGVDQKSCVAIGGNFNECASACRHDPNAQVCIMMCVQVCEFN